MIRSELAELSASADSNENRDLWRAGQHIARGDDEIDMVTRIQPLERFVFVMSILERYPDQECALLIGCTPKSVAKARMRELDLPDSLRQKSYLSAARRLWLSCDARGGHGELNSTALDIENCIGASPLQKSDLVVSVAPYSHPRTKPFAENCGTETESLFRHLSSLARSISRECLSPQKSGQIIRFWIWLRWSI
jgi:hypothetical protein